MRRQLEISRQREHHRIVTLKIVSDADRTTSKRIHPYPFLSSMQPRSLMQSSSSSLIPLRFTSERTANGRRKRQQKKGGGENKKFRIKRRRRFFPLLSCFPCHWGGRGRHLHLCNSRCRCQRGKEGHEEEGGGGKNGSSHVCVRERES